MSQTTSTTAAAIDVVGTLRKYRLRLVVPAAIVASVALVYAAVRPDTWETSQALVVRNEAAMGSVRPDNISHLDEVKSMQETLLELVKSRGVLKQALRDVGPPANCKSPATWPTTKDVEALRDAVKLSPPKGAEFGKTDVFYLKVVHSDRERAMALATAVCRHLQAGYEDLLAAKAASATQELAKTVSLAEADLEASTKALTLVEERVGSDLTELRILNEMPTGNSDLHHTATELDTELRTFRAAQSANEQLLHILQEAKTDPSRLVVTPSRLLESQPALRRLKDGLVDAQIHTAALLGSMNAEHPAVQASQAAEVELGQRLHSEIEVAIKGVEVDLSLNVDRVRTLEKHREAVQGRLAQLASVRAEYANLVLTTRHRGDILKTAQQELSAARASEAAAHTASLITALDRPDTGSRPVGPSRSLIALVGLVGGLFTGLGVVCITAKPVTVATAVLPAAGTLNGSRKVPAVVTPAVSLTFKQALHKLCNGEASCV